MTITVNAVSQGVNITITSSPVQYSDRIKIRAEFASSITPRYYQRMAFMVNGSIVGYAYTNWYGVAELSNIKILLQPSATPYEVKVYKVSNSAIFGTAQLVVTKESTQVRYTGSTRASANKYFTLSASVSDTDGSVGSFSGLPVKIEIFKGTTLVYTTTGTCNSSGSVSFGSYKLAKGTYQAKVTVLGNNYYLAGATSTSTITIS